MKKLITVEEHYSSARINDKLRRLPGFEHFALPSSGAALKAEDLGASRLAYLDRVGISRQILGHAEPFPSCLPKEHAVPLCRQFNNELNDVAGSAPSYYSCFASLPLSAPEEAAAELERCVTQLHFVGVMLSGHYEGRPYDDEWYRCIFEKAAELDVPVYIHPCKVSETIADEYYKGIWPAPAAGLFAGFGIGWHYDAGMQALRMMMAGIFDTLPKLKLILGHWGEVVAYHMFRMDEIPRQLTGLHRNFSDYFKENIYVNPSGMLYGSQFRFCLETFGVEHILWGQDYPYRMPENIRSFLEDFPLTEEDREKIAWKNAGQLFKLSEQS